MKVLITGGYGFIGSHVADRFFKEGYEIFIIDNLSTGNRNNVQIKHRSYILDVADPKCEEIFRAYRFDAVVHLAAQVSVGKSIVDPLHDARANVIGMINMLDLSMKYQVGRFIYASSAAVYGQDDVLPHTEQKQVDPLSPYGISKFVNEMYGEKWREIYQFSALGLRFSNVYGPRQNAAGEGGVVSIFMERLLRNQPLMLYGDGEQTRDFIYVEDVADAIYRGSLASISGVYNLSTNHAVSVNDLITALGHYVPDIQVKQQEARDQDIRHSRLDNSAIMRDLDWAPLYTLEEGLERTHHYFAGRVGEEEVAAATTMAVSTEVPMRMQPQPGLMRRSLPTLENLLAFMLTAWLSLSIVNTVYGVIDIKLFYITIIGIIYGKRQALLAVVLSLSLLTYQEMLAGRDLLSLTYDTDFFFRVAIYLFIGLVVGYAIERKNVRISQNEKKNEEVLERYNFLETIYKEVRDVKNELQLRILNAGDSYGKIYYATKELESLEPEVVFNSAVNVVRSIMRVDKVSIYRVDKHQNYLRLLAGAGHKINQEPRSLRIADFEYLQHMLTGKEIFTNQTLDPAYPLMAAPIYHNERVAAMIMIHDMQFESFSLYHQNLFQITTNLIASALGKAFSFIEVTENERYLTGTRILQMPIFQEILQSKAHVKEQHQVPYLLMACDLQGVSRQDASHFLAPLLRETDYLGVDEQDRLQVLLSNTQEQDAPIILSRLSHPSLSFTVVGEG